MSQSAANIIKYCEEQVSRYDRERYLCAMLAPRKKQGELLILYTFNCEVANIREQVSESILGQMRLQWWRETIENCVEGKPRPSGTAGGVYDVICANRLSKQHFLDLLNARGDDLHDTPPASMNALIGYCMGTSSSLIQLAMDILDGPETANKDMSIAARDCGIAWALTGIIRSLPHQITKGYCLLPADLLREADIKWEYLSVSCQPDSLRGIIAALASEARTRIESARSDSTSLLKSVIPALLPVTLAAHYQKQITKAHYNPFDAHLQHSHSPLKTLSLLYAAWRKKI